MSQIDVYKHECLGMIRCGDEWIPIYRLKETGKTFRAKAGDIIVGGGSGEISALRISLPEFIKWNDDDNYDPLNENEIVEVFWGTTDTYFFGIGYAQVGWKPENDGDMERFVADHVLSFLIAQKLSGFLSPTISVDQNGSICRLPTQEEKQIYDGFR